jgi:hypothetical protein
MIREGDCRVGLLLAWASSVHASSVNTAIHDQRYHRYMPSDMPPGAFPPDRGQHWGPPPPSESTPSALSPTAPPRTFARPPRWPAFIALPIALIALAVGVVGWFRPTSHTNGPPPKPTYTDQQVASAKSNVCTAFDKIEHAVSVSDNERASSSDRASQLGAAALARQVLDFGSRYLLAKLAEEPATPADLASAIRQEANAFQDLYVGYIDGVSISDPDLQPAANANDEARTTIQRLCK